MSDTLLTKSQTESSERGKFLPILLHFLREGSLDEVSFTFDQEKGVFRVNAVSHQFCEEHGCTDEDCRLLEHTSHSMSYTDPDLDEYVDSIFHRAYNEKSAP